MANKVSDITILLDRSGSMRSIRDVTVKNINDFIEDINRVPGDGVWSLLQFDDPDSARGAGEGFPHIVFEGRSHREVPRFEVNDFRPRGSTALIDAMCRTIQRTRDRLQALPTADRPAVMIVVMTDGQENASRDFTSARLRELVGEMQSAAHGWEFIYLGANQDAFAEAGRYGIDTTNAVNYSADTKGVDTAWHQHKGRTRNWKLDGNESASGLLGDAAPEDPAKEV